jgi:hypothetical protein
VPPHYIQNLNDNVYVLNHLLQQSQIINSSKQNKIKLNGSVGGGRNPIINPTNLSRFQGVVSILIRSLFGLQVGSSTQPLLATIK